MICTCVASLLLAAGARAQAPRTFVASTGSDSNPCSRTAPCRTFQAAINAVSAGGEVVALDSAGYGTVGGPITIGKSVTVTAPDGVFAGVNIPSNGGNGIEIFALPTDTVVLRGLTIEMMASHNAAIAFFGGAALHVENCVVRGPGGGDEGLLFFPATTSNLYVTDSTFTGNGAGIFASISLPSGSPTVFATIDHVNFNGNGAGLIVSDLSKVNLRDSVISGSTSVAIQFGSSIATGITVELNIEKCLLTSSFIGVSAAVVDGDTGIVRISNSTVTDNSVVGLVQGPNITLLSRGNNTIQGNGMDVSGTLGTYTAK
jgi:hypothetical protein